MKRFKTTVAAALTAVALLGSLGFMAACGPEDAAEPAAQAYVSPYDWSGLERSGDRLAFRENGEVRSQFGVDVSDHQGAIDWSAVASDGVDFAFVRVGNRGYTEGALYADARYAENIDNATSAGLDVGAYFFSQAVTVEEAREEAEFVLRLLAGRYLALPVAYDHEPVADGAGRANNMDRETLTACARAFCERLEQGGYGTMIYGNSGDMARYDRADLGGRPVWFAEYDAPSRTRSSTSPSGSTPTAAPWQASTPPSTSTCCCRPRSKTRPWHVHRFVIHWPSLFARNHEEHARWLVAFSAKSLSRFAIHPCAARSRNA